MGRFESLGDGEAINDVFEDGLDVGTTIYFNNQTLGAIVIKNGGGLLFVDLEAVFDGLLSIIGTVFNLSPFEKTGQAILLRQGEVDNPIDLSPFFSQKISQIFGLGDITRSAVEDKAVFGIFNGRLKNAEDGFKRKKITLGQKSGDDLAFLTP